MAGLPGPVLIAGLVAVLTACTAPPAPPFGKPAPTLPAESIAYDDIDFATDREAVFDNTCAALPDGFTTAAALTSEPFQVDSPMAGESGCGFYREPWGRMWIEAVDPPEQDDDEEPQPAFAAYWKGSDRFGYSTPAWFRRTILLDRYYAVQVMSFSAAGPDCSTIVDTGALQVLLVAVGPPDDGTEYESDDRAVVDRVAADYCPRGRQIAEQLLTGLDADGGSRAS